MELSYEVLSQHVQEKIEVYSLNWIQKLLCKWFNIIHEKKYWYTIELKVSLPHYLRVGDCICSSNRDIWIVTKVNDSIVNVKNLNPLLTIGVLCKLFMISSSFYESAKQSKF